MKRLNIRLRLTLWYGAVLGAILAASLALIVGGSMAFSNVRGFPPSPGVTMIAGAYVRYVLMPFERAEAGFAVGASWLVLIQKQNHRLWR